MAAACLLQSKRAAQDGARGPDPTHSRRSACPPDPAPTIPPASYSYYYNRMYTCAKALVFGEDLAVDTVGTALSFVLRWVSHGSIVIDTRLLSQYLTLAFIGV